MARPTVKQLRRDVEELLKLAGFHQRYEELKKKVKADMVKLKHDECKIEHFGRVFISKSERMTVTPDLAREILSPEMAANVIKIKESVPNDRIRAFVMAELITPEERDKLLKKAKRSLVVNLHVRPLE